jgi:hypothetical protein
VGWSFFDERAGIAEFDGALSRTEAESQFACCVIGRLDRNPTRSLPGRCLACGDAERDYDRLVPFGSESSGHAWLHSRCWSVWRDAREAEVIAALSARGIHTKEARAKKTANETTSAVVLNDPDDMKGALKTIGGSCSDRWNNILADQKIQTLWLKHS